MNSHSTPEASSPPEAPYLWLPIDSLLDDFQDQGAQVRYYSKQDKKAFLDLWGGVLVGLEHPLTLIGDQPVNSIGPCRDWYPEVWWLVKQAKKHLRRTTLSTRRQAGTT